MTVPGPPTTVKNGPAARLVLRSTRLRLGHDGRIRLAVRCAGNARCGVQLRLRLGGRTIATAVRTLRAGRTTTITLRLARPQRAQLRRAGRAQVAIRPIGATAGRPTSATLRLR